MNLKQGKAYNIAAHTCIKMSNVTARVVTDIHTDTQDKYCNTPECAPRVNNLSPLHVSCSTAVVSCIFSQLEFTFT